MTKNSFSPPSGETWARDRLIDLLGAAAAVNEYGFVRNTALQWLAAFPGDLPIQLIYAKAVSKDQNKDQATELVHKIIQVDPEYKEAQNLRIELFEKESVSHGDYGEFHALQPPSMPGWVINPPPLPASFLI